jgi:hypothetical protein
MPRNEAGQSAVEWSALVLIVAVALAGLGYAVNRAEAWRLGDALVEAIVCAVGDGCPVGSVEDAYGAELARTLHRFTPNILYEQRSAQLPVDFRRCRTVDCANGADRAAPIAESDLGLPVTAFTHVIDRRPAGGSLYLQYWLYFPESFSAGVGRRLGPLSQYWPGYHADDWEGYQVRVGPGDQVSARASAHGRYRGSKYSDGWSPRTGWYRVSGGSHAGHLVVRPDGERTTPASELRLVPLEGLRTTDLYRFEVSPPWRKAVYQHPESDAS